MPSPFPGMDPYLEGPDLWPDVHLGLLTAIGHRLTSTLRPSFVARIREQRFAVEPDDPAGPWYVMPDVRLGNPDSLPQARHRYLEVREPLGRQVVTLIAVVSPSDKLNGSAGRRTFLDAHDEARAAGVNWLEIDLLRDGTRTLTSSAIPPSAYFAFVDRAERNGPIQPIWPITLRSLLPVLPVPLRRGEADVALDLQAVLNTAYDRAGYDSDVNYREAPDPQFTSDDDAAWADALLREKGLR